MHPQRPMPTYPSVPQPKLVAMSSIGLTLSAHAVLPCLIEPVYSALDIPHRDKVGLGRVLAHCTGWTWTDAEPAAH
ncbi:hypothetical protein C8F04DRAFT_1091074, partial [Mycena alexandri]